ncbi:MAG: cyclic dehypoxanthinyl futalosine synthase [Terriglobia bacterium]
MRVSSDQALDMLASNDLLGLGMEADAVRRRLHPGGVITYQVDRNINYTNFCTEYCSFCAFYRPAGSSEGYVQPLESIFQKIDETLALGGTGILMQGGLHPDLKMDYYIGLLSTIKKRYPALHLHCLSAPEILNIAQLCGMSVRDVIARLRDAGLDSIPGAGAEILDDEVRHRIARLKCSTDEWLAVHRTAHQLGLRTTATMMFGVGESLRHRVNHFERVRQLQDETGGFTAFIPWFFQRENTSLGRFVKEEATAADYLKTLAVSRLYLDNILNVQASWLTPGHKICQVALRFGGNDVGSILIEENVVSAAGCRNTSTERELRRLISDAGFRPIKRDTLYRTYFLN